MKVYAKLRVVFPSSPLFDLGELVEQLEKHYRIGYAGLFSVSTSKTCLVLQTHSKRTRMSIGKIRKVVGAFVAHVEVLTGVDNFLDLQLLEERGRFRTRGGSRRTSRVKLHVNALGEEDLSHITSEQVEALVGSEDEVVDFFDRNYSARVKKSIIVAEWEKFRRYSRNKVRRWDQQQRLGGRLCREIGIRETMELDSDFEDDLQQVSKRPVYDPDSDSEGNAERKRKLLRLRFLEQAPDLKKDDFLKEFEALIFENPHNSNVMASTKDAYFKYFDGQLWRKDSNKNFFPKVTMARISKATEISEKLQLSEFTRDQVSSMVTQLESLKDTTEAVKDGILAAENQEARIQLVPRKVVRVGFNPEDQSDAVTWEELLGRKK